MFILFALALITAFVLMRRGVLPTPPWIGDRRPSPELEARRVLAERFATGEIGSDEFLERASVLNWTPGVEPVTRRGRRR